MYRPWSFRAARRAADNRGACVHRATGSRNCGPQLAEPAPAAPTHERSTLSDLRIAWTSLLNDVRRGLFSRRVTLGLLGGGLRLPLSCRVGRQGAEPAETRRKRDDERRTIVRRRTCDELVERC